MDVESGILGAVGLLGALAIFVLAILTILIPVSAYLAQKYAHRCYQELRGVNTRLGSLEVSLKYLADAEANKLTAGKVREAGQ